MTVVVVTGASAGVGRATARVFAANGADVALLARAGEGLDAAVRDATAFGVRAVAFPVDVAEPDEVEVAASAVEKRLGPIDVWVNNAMVGVLAPVKELEALEVRRVTEVTYLGYVNGTLAALRRMLPRDAGTIVQVGSALAYRSIPLQAAYCGAKHAIKGFTQSLRTELLHDGSGVRVTMVDLPAVNTPQFELMKTRLTRHPRPVPPIYQPEVAAEAIVWAADHAPRAVAVGFSTALAIVAEKVAPAAGDRYLARTAYESQQTSERVRGDRADNLWASVPGDHGAHGAFGDEARGRSLHFALRRRRGAVVALATVAAALAWTTRREKAARRAAAGLRFRRE